MSISGIKNTYVSVFLQVSVGPEFTFGIHSRPTIYERFVQICIENNVSGDNDIYSQTSTSLIIQFKGGIIDEEEEVIKKRLSAAIKALSGKCQR